ncbi:MAG: hypothetical protein WCR79_01695 [Fusobacterium sp.]
MANKFISEVKTQPLSTVPRLISSNIDTRKIVETTSGNAMADMVFNEANAIAKRLDTLKRKNELASVELAADTNLRNYEAQWSGKDKLDDSSFNSYKEGLENVYEENKKLIGNTKFTTEDDINNWYNTTTSYSSKQAFVLKGQKNQYDIQKVTNESITNATGLMMDYVETQDNDKAYNSRKKALGILDGLKTFLPDDRVEKMKLDSVIKSNQERLRRQMQAIISDDGLSLDRKQDAINLIMNGADKDTAYAQDIDNLIKDKSINSKYKDAYVGELKNSTKDFIYGVGKQLNEQIVNQKYTEERRIRSAQEQLQNSYNSNYRRIDSNIRSGNYTIAISDIEDKPLAPTDVMKNPSLCTKYFGNNLSDIVSEGGYIQMFSSTEASSFKREIQANEDSGQDRSASIYNVINEINSYEDPIEKENIAKSLIGRGVINLEDYQLNSTNPEALNAISLGRTTNKSNKILYSNVTNSKIYEKVKDLSPYKQNLINEYMLGKISKGEIGWSNQLSYDALSFSRAYNRNAEFRQAFDDIFVTVSQMETMKLKERKASSETFKKALDDKYNSKGILVKTSTGLKEIKTYREGYTDSVFD